MKKKRTLGKKTENKEKKALDEKTENRKKVRLQIENCPTDRSLSNSIFMTLRSVARQSIHTRSVSQSIYVYLLYIYYIFLLRIFITYQFFSEVKYIRLI